MKGEWLHYVYTACPEFRIYGLSADITEHEARDLEKLSGYRPPASAPSAPSDELVGGFPVKHGFFRLSSGRFGILRSQCIGQVTPGGRFGNFLTEAFVYDGDLLPQHPCRYLGSPSFCDALAFRNSVWAAGPLVNPLVLANLAKNSILPRAHPSLVDVHSFLDRNSAIVEGILDAALRRKKVAFQTGSEEDWLLIMECVQHALPCSLAHELTCVSYCHDPMDNENYELKSFFEPLPGYIMSNVLDSTHYEVVSGITRHGSSPYVEAIMPLLSEPASLQSFLLFIGSFDSKSIDVELNDAALLHGISESPGSDLAVEDFKRVLALAMRCKSRDFVEGLLDSLTTERYLGDFFESPNDERVESMIEVLFSPDLVNHGKSVSHQLSFYWNGLISFLSSGSPDSVIGFLAKIHTNSPKFSEIVIAEPEYERNLDACIGCLEDPSHQPARALNLLELLLQLGLHLNEESRSRWLESSSSLRAVAIVATYLSQYHVKLDTLARTQSPAECTMQLRLLVPLLEKLPVAPSGLAEQLGSCMLSLDDKSKSALLALLSASKHEAGMVELLRQALRAGTDDMLPMLRIVNQQAGLSKATKKILFAASVGLMNEGGNLISSLNVIVEFQNDFIEHGIPKESLLEIVDTKLTEPPWDETLLMQLGKLSVSGNQVSPALPNLMLALWLVRNRGTVGVSLNSGSELEQNVMLSLDAKSYALYASYLIKVIWSEASASQYLRELYKILPKGRVVETAQIFEKLLESEELMPAKPSEELRKLVDFAQLLVKANPESMAIFGDSLVASICRFELKDFRVALEGIHGAKLLSDGGEVAAVLDQAHRVLNDKRDRRLPNRIGSFAGRALRGIFKKGKSKEDNNE